MAKLSVLALAAHPDDEVLGCGATLARHVDRGDAVHIVIAGAGLAARYKSGASRPAKLSADQMRLQRAASRASEIIGAKTLVTHDFPDNRLDGIDRLDIVRFVEDQIQRVQPHIIYTHHAGDVNIDHRRIHEAVVTACRPQPGHSVQTLLFFEVASSTEWQPPGSGTAFTPHYFVDVSATLDRKINALKAYRSEMREFPHPRSITAITHQAHWRGSIVGCNAAEAFMLGRHIERGKV